MRGDVGAAEAVRDLGSASYSRAADDKSALDDGTLAGINELLRQRLDCYDLLAGIRSLSLLQLQGLRHGQLRLRNDRLRKLLLLPTLPLFSTSSLAWSFTMP